LEQRGVFWVTRAKENLQFEVIENYQGKEGGKIVSDELVGLKNAGSQKAYPELMRRIVAWVEVDGQERLMTFLTNNPTWSAESVAELYKCRWRIEVFFKQIKQTLQLADFLGTSAHPPPGLRRSECQVKTLTIEARQLSYVQHILVSTLKPSSGNNNPNKDSRTT
jgi:hypothetical protein